MESQGTLPRSIGIPPALRARVEYTPQGKKRSPKRIAWFKRYLETGRGSQSVLDAGYDTANPGKMHQQLARYFHKDLVEAGKHLQAMGEPPAWVFLMKMVEKGIVELEKPSPNPQILNSSVKASGEILDRGGMPKGAVLKGISITPKEDEGQGDYRKSLDFMVSVMGLDAVRLMPRIMEYKLHREYLEEQYGELKEVNPNG